MLLLVSLEPLIQALKLIVASLTSAKVSSSFLTVAFSSFKRSR